MIFHGWMDPLRIAGERISVPVFVNDHTDDVHQSGKDDDACQDPPGQIGVDRCCCHADDQQGDVSGDYPNKESIVAGTVTDPGFSFIEIFDHFLSAGGRVLLEQVSLDKHY